MNSALKPAGVTPSPVQQPLNKPLLQQNTPPTYGQPMSHIPQNLVNIPHSTPANAHSNNMHSTNHYSISASPVSQHFGVGGSIPPPSNHPVANTNQSPTKSITHSSNNVAHLYKLPVPPPAPTPEVIAVADDSELEKPQSNGTPSEKPLLNQEPLKIHQTETTIKDKPTAPQPQASVPEKPSETIENTTLEKPIEVETTIVPIEATVQSTADNEIPPLETTPPKTEILPKTTIVETSPPVPKSIVVTPPPSAESDKTLPDVPAVNTTSDAILQVEKVTEVVTPPTPSLPVAAETPKVVELPKTTESPKETVQPSVKQAPTLNVKPPTVNKPKEQAVPKPTLKLVTTHKSPVRKIKVLPQATIEQQKPTKSEIKISVQKSTGLIAKNKRTRTRTQPYQCPLPEVEMISKISASTSTSKPKTSDDKLIVFYKNEFLAVRNPDGGFYICQALHNIFKSTRKLRILWLSQDKSDGDIYTPDFYDQTDFDCILTNCKLTRVAKGKFKLPAAERIRTDNILKRALAVEKGDATACPTEEHPDGLDLSLYKEEAQLKKQRGRKRKTTLPLKSLRSSQADKAPDQAKVRKIEPRRKPPPVTKALVIRKALGVKAKETSITAKPAKPKVADVEVVAAPVIDPKKAKVLAKVVKKTVAVPSTSQAPSIITKHQPPRKPSTQSVDTVVPFLRKDPPVLKKEIPVKQFLVLKKESALKKEAPSKKEIPVKKGPDALKKDAPAIRKEMPVLKKEAPIVKTEVSVQKPILTRKSSRGKK